jgi:hypothetical protein
LEKLKVGGRHRNKCGYYNNGTLKIWNADVNSIQVAQGSDQWWILVNMKTYLQVTKPLPPPKKKEERRISGISKRIVGSSKEVAQLTLHPKMGRGLNSQHVMYHLSVVKCYMNQNFPQAPARQALPTPRNNASSTAHDKMCKSRSRALPSCKSHQIKLLCSSL